jgi:antitoxin HicB
MDYPVTLARDDNGTILISFPDLPEAHTFGEDESDALRRAKDTRDGHRCLHQDRRDIPSPSALVARHRVSMPALVEAKVRLYETMRAAKVNKSELARRLDWHLPQVDRLLEMTHASKLEQLDDRASVQSTMTSTKANLRVRVP